MSVYVSENAPPKIRGRIAGLFQELLVIGATFGYWLDYGVSKHIPMSTKQWRVPVAVPLIPGGLMLIGQLFLKESPRWLASRGRLEEAHAALAHVLRLPPDDPHLLKELAEIRAAVEEEQHATEGLSWKELFSPVNRKRFLLAFLVMLWQQFSGTNSISYYTPEIFQTIGISASDSSLFATGIYGTVKVVATGIFLVVSIDRWSRRGSLVWGAGWMSSMMLIIGILLVKFPPDGNGVSSPSIAMAVMVFSAAQWLFNFVITKITPIAISNVGWWTFIIFAVFCLAMGVFVFLFVPEIKQRTLEEIDVLFGAVDAETRHRDVEDVLASKEPVEGEHIEATRA